MAGRHLAMSAARRFSTSSSALQMVKPPVAVYGVEGRYATALYSAASKQKALDAVEKDLSAFAAQIQKDKKLQDFLHDPSVNKALKADGMSAACDKMKMNALSKNLFLAMGENGRYGIIPQVCNSFKTIMAAQRGEVICEVTSAKPLDAAMSKEVEAAIGGLLKSGEKSKISYKVDPSIIGGLVVSVGDKYVDMSIGSKLKKYEAMIKSAA